MLIWMVLLLPIIAASVCEFLPWRIAGYVSFLFGCATFAVASCVAMGLLHGGTATAIDHWVGADPLSSLVLMLETFAGAIALLFSVGMLESDEAPDSAKRRYFIWFNLFLFAGISVLLMREIALIWLALTLTTLFSVFLVSFDRTPAALEAAWKYAMLTILGAAIALLGILLLYWGATRAGAVHFTFSAVGAVAADAPVPIMSLGFVLVLIGFATKAALVPFHAWLPDTYSRAPFAVCAMLSILESALIPYVLLRLHFSLLGAHGVHSGAWLMVIGLVSAGGAAFLMLQTHEYKRLFAYSTIENAGIILTVGSLSAAAAHTAAIWQIMTHALTKPLVFYCAGLVFVLTGERRIANVHGLFSRSALVGGLMMLSGVAVAGAPPFALFLSELGILKAGLASHHIWVFALLGGFMIVSFCAITYHLFGMMTGAPDAAQGVPRRMAPASLAAVALAAVPVVVFGGFIPATLQQLLSHAAAVLSGPHP